MIRSLFGEAIKTNEFLQFAVMIGCLRVSKESIFTGLNNFKIFSITDSRFDEQFGFTEDEVEKMLKDYQLETHLASMKEWYDGYRFGDADIYCPWDVINRVDDLCDTPEAEPKCYWINSSGNALVKRFVSIANRTTQDEIERLIAGEPIENEATAIPLALDGGLRQPKVRYYCILMAWEHGKLKTGTNTYYNIKLQYQDI